MSFNTMYVDLLKWQVVNVPIMKDMDLRTFWGESPLRMVAYEVNATPEVPGKSTDVYNKENGKPFRGIEKHEQKSLNYIFCAQVSTETRAFALPLPLGVAKLTSPWHLLCAQPGEVSARRTKSC